MAASRDQFLDLVEAEISPHTINQNATLSDALQRVVPQSFKPVESTVAEWERIHKRAPSIWVGASWCGYAVEMMVYRRAGKLHLRFYRRVRRENSNDFKSVQIPVDYVKWSDQWINTGTFSSTEAYQRWSNRTKQRAMFKAFMMALWEHITGVNREDIFEEDTRSTVSAQQASEGAAGGRASVESSTRTEKAPAPKNKPVAPNPALAQTNSSRPRASATETPVEEVMRPWPKFTRDGGGILGKGALLDIDDLAGYVEGHTFNPTTEVLKESHAEHTRTGARTITENKAVDNRNYTALRKKFNEERKASKNARLSSTLPDPTSMTLDEAYDTKIKWFNEGARAEAWTSEVHKANRMILAANSANERRLAEEASTAE